MISRADVFTYLQRFVASKKIKNVFYLTPDILKMAKSFLLNIMHVTWQNYLIAKQKYYSIANQSKNIFCAWFLNRLKILDS